MVCRLVSSLVCRALLNCARHEKSFKSNFTRSLNQIGKFHPKKLQ